MPAQDRAGDIVSQRQSARGEISLGDSPPRIDRGAPQRQGARTAGVIMRLQGWRRSADLCGPRRGTVADNAELASDMVAALPPVVARERVRQEAVGRRD